MLFKTLSRSKLKGFVCRNYANHAETARKVDVVIVGGGLVGAACANSLAQNPLLKDKKIVVLEAAPKKSYSLPGDFSNRVIAINQTTKGFFEQIGVWETITKMRYRPVQGMNVWDWERSSNLLKFEAEPGNDHFYIVENDLVVHALEEKLETSPSVQVWNECGIEKFQADQGKLRVTVKGGEEIRTKMLIGADGANSAVRRGMKRCPYLSKSYNQFGVVATLHFKKPIANCFAWQKFLPSGPVAILPLSDTKSSLVWSLPSTEALAKLKSQNPEEFLKDLKSRLEPIPKSASEFPEIESISNMAGFPLGLGHASRYVEEPGIVLVGDAAHRVHPLAGQGVNLGFGDVICLTECLRDCVKNGAKFGAHPYLLGYETKRQRYNVPMMLAIDSLQKIYSSEYQIAKFVKFLGINLVNNSSSLKKMFTNFAG